MCVHKIGPLCERGFLQGWFRWFIQLCVSAKCDRFRVYYFDKDTAGWNPCCSLRFCLTPLCTTPVSSLWSSQWCISWLYNFSKTSAPSIPLLCCCVCLVSATTIIMQTNMSLCCKFGHAHKLSGLPWFAIQQGAWAHCCRMTAGCRPIRKVCRNRHNCKSIVDAFCDFTASRAQGEHSHL